MVAGGIHAARLDQVIRDLEPPQGRLRRNLDACNVVTRLPGTGDSPVTGTASPTS